MKKLSYGLGAIALALILFIVLYLPHNMLAAHNQQPKQTPADFDIGYSDVYFQPADEPIKLHAWWMPVEGARAVILMVHGANGSKEGRFANSLGIYRDLNRTGYSVLAPDLRNHGSSGRSQTGRLGMGVDERPDLIAALDYIDANNPDNLPVYALGMSMGGAAIIHLAEVDKRPAGLILFDPMLDTDSALFEGAKTTGAPDWMAQLVLAGTKAQMGLPGRALDAAAEQTLPTLLIQDVGDPVTKIEFAQALLQQRPDIDYWPVADPEPEHFIYQQHGAWGTHVAAYYLQPQEFVRRIRNFIDGNLATAAQTNR